MITMTKVPEAADAALDVLLTGAADGGSRFLRPGAAIMVGAGLVRRPNRAARQVGHLGAELARIAGGRSRLRPPSGTAVSPIPRGSRAGSSAGCCRRTWPLRRRWTD
jgi:hypothetical protein